MAKAKTQAQAKLKALGSIAKAIVAIDEEMARHRIGHGRVGSEAQLQKGKEMLSDMEENLGAESPKLISTGMGRWIVLDTWPMNDPLGIMIIRAELDYEDVWKRRQ